MSELRFQIRGALLGCRPEVKLVVHDRDRTGQDDRTLMSGIAHWTTFSAERTQQIAAVINNSHQPESWPESQAAQRASQATIQVAGARSMVPRRCPSRGGVLICDGQVPDAANERRLVSVDGLAGPTSGGCPDSLPRWPSACGQGRDVEGNPSNGMRRMA